MTRWSRRQDAVLWEHGHEGAEECADIIRRRFGVARTPEAVRRHAYRIGAPMRRYEICPECGRKTDELCRDGLCPVCHEYAGAEGQRRFRQEVVEAEIAVRRTEEYRTARREHAKERKATSTLCRKHGVPGKRARSRNGDSIENVT